MKRLNVAALAAVVVAGLSLLVACSSSSGTADEKCGSSGLCDGDVVSVDTASVAFRPVLEMAELQAGSCPEGGIDGGSTAAQCTPDGYISYSLGPTAVDGTGITSAQAFESPQTGGWVVNPILADSESGLEAFNALAARCYQRDATCPTGQVAIVVDGRVVSAPSMFSPGGFAADAIQITGGFTEEEAVQLAAAISPS